MGSGEGGDNGFVKYFLADAEEGVAGAGIVAGELAMACGNGEGFGS